MRWCISSTGPLGEVPQYRFRRSKLLRNETALPEKQKLFQPKRLCLAAEKQFDVREIVSYATLQQKYQEASQE